LGDLGIDEDVQIRYELDRCERGNSGNIENGDGVRYLPPLYRPNVSDIYDYGCKNEYAGPD
jgi:hypothetical protein